MCLRYVYTKEEFEEKYGETPKYGWKIFDFDPETEEVTPFFYNGAKKVMPIVEWLHEKDYREEDYSYENISAEDLMGEYVPYPIGFHIFLYRQDAEQIRNYFVSTTTLNSIILPIEIGKVETYGVELRFGNDDECPTVICKTIKVLRS